MEKKTFAVVGFGDRSEQYTKYILAHPEQASVTAVVDPNPVRLNFAKSLFSLRDCDCYSDFDEFVKKGKIADCVINGTMDKLHISTSLPLLRLHYDMLLEKPITSDKSELLELERVAKENNCNVVICHVLRYTPFYKRIKQTILDGVIGEIRHIETAENVGVAHASISYIRGKWNNKEECGSSYLLAKCCHDLDLLCWLNDKATPKKVVSFGSRNYFIPENAPAGAGSRCLVDCKVEKQCPYSARKIHLDNNPMPITVWFDIPKMAQDITYEERENALRTTNPHGKCIFKTNANIVDEQMTMLMFNDGSTAYHNLFSGTARAGRRIMIYGTKGEIDGFTEDVAFKLRLYNPSNILFDEKVINIADEIAGDNHYGGDSRIMEDFLRVERGEQPSFSTSKLSDSIMSHLCVYAADESMETNKIIEIK